jgi:4-amino-4-deoxy-L-arabinose transferase-like glycosyltransferase
MNRHDRLNIDSQVNRGVATAAGKWFWLAKAAFVLFCIEALFSISYRSVYLFRQSVSQGWIAGICVLAAIGICFVVRQPILLALGRLLKVPTVGNKAWLTFWLIFGLVLRMAWVWRFPVTLKSDNLAYFQFATTMSHWQTGTGAHWPPGFSLFLAPFFMVFGAHQWVAQLCALLFFVATYLLTYALAKRIQGGLTSRIAPMLISIWPGYFTLAGINCKEAYLAVLVPAAVLLYLKAFDGGSAPGSGLGRSSDSGALVAATRFRLGFLIGAGLCMGLAALTQPGYMLFPAVILAVEMLRGSSVLRAIGRTAVFSIAVVAAISPWTCRNYLVFHRIVLISTNGGDVFYRANNPLADANYSAEGEISLPKDEFAADKLGYKLAEDWIERHPIDFGGLMVRKQVVFLGDDALGAYETLKRDLNPSVAFYASVKGISNLFWLAVWTVLLFGFPLLFRHSDWRLWYGLLFLPLVYQWAIDSLFESGPRHHVPYIALIGVLVSMVLSSAVQCSDLPAQ